MRTVPKQHCCVSGSTADRFSRKQHDSMLEGLAFSSAHTHTLLDTQRHITSLYATLRCITSRCSTVYCRLTQHHIGRVVLDTYAKCIFACTYALTHAYTYAYIQIYRESERERERNQKRKERVAHGYLRIWPLLATVYGSLDPTVPAIPTVVVFTLASFT